MFGVLNPTATQFTSLKIPKNSTSQKKEKFILYSRGQPLNELRKKFFLCIVGAPDQLSFFIYSIKL
jgi:hypothetical protein